MTFTINGTFVPAEVFEQEFEALKEHFQSRGEAICCDRDAEVRQYAKDNVVNRILLEQASLAQGGPIDESEVRRKFDAVVAEHGGTDAFYDNTGFARGDESVILEKLRSNMLVDRLLATEGETDQEATPAEIAAYYEKNQERFLSPEEVRVSQLFIEPSSHEAAREAYLALREVREELLNGKDFTLAAREHGTDESRDIDLGFMKQGDTMPEIESIVFSMRIGEISPIVATHYGFHLFTVTEKKERTPIPADQIPGLAEQSRSDRRNRTLLALIDRLREEAVIEESATAPV
jgi:PPIC-type PPIASE domain